MPQLVRADLVFDVSDTAPPPRRAACPWCGHAGIVGDEPLEFLVCDACAGVSLLDAEPLLVAPEDDDDWLEDTAEYDLVPSGPRTFRVERR